MPENLVKFNISESIQLHEDRVNQNPENIEAFVQLGLAYLKDDDEEAAQLTWFAGIAQFPEEQLQLVTEHVVKILHDEAVRLASDNEFELSYLIRCHLYEIQPDNLENFFLLILASISLGRFNPDILHEWLAAEIADIDNIKVDLIILEKTLKQTLLNPCQQSLDFAEACLKYFANIESWSNLLIEAACQLDAEFNLGYYAASVLECCLRYDSENILAFSYLPRFYINCEHYAEAILSARRFYSISKTLEIQFCSNCLLLQTLMKAGAWNEIPDISDRHKNLIKQLIEANSTQLELGTIQFLTVYSGSLAYLQDNLAENRWFQNEAGKLLLSNLKANVPQIFKPTPVSSPKGGQRIKIGYIASTLRNHSVGWLSRWIFKNHDRDSFEICIYLVQQQPDHPFFQEWFAPYVDQYTLLGEDIGQAADIIRNDQLDVLVDLDSLTLGFTATIMALKPAPIQVTWLGCDASGIPGIDYFIADPHVLPAEAQKHYQEKIWTMPSTYIAVEGFETELPSIRRSDLGIPTDAVVYLSAQTGVKRDPETLRLQLKIIKEVPNSYFLIKGLADQFVLKEFITTLAQEEEIPLERIHFLPIVSNEYQHRANLGIADVVLDTYPYNGATTTLETLWMGIPLVTRVGEQFAARNSYAFLMNVGVTEGIAWTHAEYVEWGIRLGINEDLRRQVAWKLKQSKQTSPLWNARQFTRDMENSYRAMHTLSI